MKYKVAKSKIHGDGIFATQPIAKGEYISDTPDYINDINQTIASSFHNHDEKNANVLNIKKGNKRFLIAKRGIEAGEELTTDYNLTPSPPYEDPKNFKDTDEKELSISNPEELQALIDAGYEVEEMKEGGNVSWNFKGKTYSGTLIPGMEDENNRYARTHNGKIKTLPKAENGIINNGSKSDGEGSILDKMLKRTLNIGKPEVQESFNMTSPEQLYAQEQVNEELRKQKEAELFRAEVLDEDDHFRLKKNMGFYGDTFYLADDRKISATTGEKIVPTRDLFNSRYSRKVVEKIIEASREANQDPYTMLAIALQETKLGKDDNNLGHVKSESGEGAGPLDYIWTYRSMQDKARKKRGDAYDDLDEALKIQIYNGLGKVFPKTEKGYHGYEMSAIYGVPLTKEGIDMSKNPLYGKRIIDLRDNVLKHSDAINFLISDYDRKTNKYGGGIEIDLTPEQVKMYKNGGYILEELDEGGEPGHTHEEDPPDYEELMKAYKDSIAAKEAYDKQYALDLKDYEKNKVNAKAEYDEDLKRYNDKWDTYRDNKAYIEYLSNKFDYLPKSFDDPMLDNLEPSEWNAVPNRNDKGHRSVRNKDGKEFAHMIDHTLWEPLPEMDPDHFLDRYLILWDDASVKDYANRKLNNVVTTDTKLYAPPSDHPEWNRFYTQFENYGESYPKNVIEMYGKPTQKKPSLDEYLKKPEYNPPVVLEKPEYQPIKLDVIKPELISNPVTGEIIIPEEEFDNNYKAKRVVDKIKTYKVNKRGKLRRGPFGTKTTRSVRYEIPEEEQLYPEGYVPIFAPGGVNDLGDKLKRFARKFDNTGLTLNWGKLNPQTFTYVPTVGLNTLSGSNRKGWWDSDIKIGGDKDGLSTSVGTKYFGPFWPGQRTFQGSVDGSAFYDQGHLGTQLSAGVNIPLGYGRSNRGKELRGGRFQFDLQPFRARIGARKDYNAPAYTWWTQLNPNEEPTLMTSTKGFDIDWGYGAKLDGKYRLKKLPIELFGSAEYSADMVRNAQLSAEQYEPDQVVPIQVDNPDDNPYVSGDAYITQELINYGGGKDREFKPDHKFNFNIGAKLLLDDINFKRSRAEKKIKELEENDPFYNPGIRVSNPDEVEEEYEEQEEIKQEDGGFILDLDEEEIKRFVEGGYVLEELQEGREDDEQKKEKKEKKKNPCPPGLMPGPKDANGQNTCIEDPNYIRPIGRDEADTTVYGTDKGKEKQRNLIQKLDQAKRAMKSFYKDRGLKGLFLKQDPTQEIGVLQQNIEGYKDFLEEEKKRYAIADKALLNLQKYYPQTWNDRNVSDVLSGTGYQSISNLFKSGKISQPTFMSFYNNFANEFDPNMVKGYGPNAGYDGRKLREVWGDGWDEFVDLIGKFAMGAPMAGAAGSLGPSIVPILESLAPVASAAGSAMTAPLFSGAPSWLTPGLVAEFAGAVYSADQITDKNSATRQSINRAIENPNASNIAGATAETIMTGLGLGPTVGATFKGAKPLLKELVTASQVPPRAQSFASGSGSLVDDVVSGVSDIKNAVKGSTKAEVKALPRGNTTYIPEESLPFKQNELNPEFQNKNITGIFRDKAKAAKTSDLPTQRISENFLKDNDGSFVRIKPDRLESIKQQQDELAQFALDFNTVWMEGNLSNKTKRVTKDLQKLLKEQEELNKTGGAAYQKLRQVKSASNKDVNNYETNVFAQLKGGYSPSHSVTEAEKMIKQLKSEMEAVKSVKRKSHYKDAISTLEKHVVEFKKDILKPPVKSKSGNLNLVPEDSWFIQDNSKSFRTLREDIIKARSDENLVKSANNYNNRIIPLSSKIDEAVNEVNILDILEPDVRKRIETLRQTYDAPLSSENVISSLETRGTLGQVNRQGYKTSSVVEGRAGDPSLKGTHLKDYSQQNLNALKGEASGSTSAATKRSDPLKIRVEDAVSEYRGKTRGTDDEIERIYEVWSKDENPVLEGYVNYNRNIYTNPLDMAGTVGHEDRHVYQSIMRYLDPYTEWADEFGYSVSKLDTKTGKYLSQVMEDPVVKSASGKKNFQTWLSSPKEVDSNLVKERVKFAWDKYTKAKQAKPNASREELIQDIVKDMKLPKNRKKFIEDLMTSPQGNSVQQHFKKTFRGSIDPANDTQAIMSRKQFVRDFLETLPIIIIGLGLQSSMTSDDSSSEKTNRLGGSIEADLSLEDVQRYIDQGYILEEIN